MLAIAELHLDAMRFTPTLCRYLLRLILCGKALQQCFQPCQQALFIAIPERHLHLAASHSDVDVTACRSLWQCWDWLTLGLSLGLHLGLFLGLLGWCLAGAIAGPIPRVQLGLSQGKSTLGNPCGNPVLAPVASTVWLK